MSTMQVPCRQAQQSNTPPIFLSTHPKKGIRNIYSYVYKTIKNRFISIVQSNKRREEREEKYLFIKELEKQNSSDTENISSYRKTLLSSLKNRLNERDYHLLQLLYSGMPIDEIANELDVSVKRIKNRRSEILRKLSITSMMIIFILHVGITIQNLVKNLVS